MENGLKKWFRAIKFRAVDIFPSKILFNNIFEIFQLYFLTFSQFKKEKKTFFHNYNVRSSNGSTTFKRPKAGTTIRSCSGAKDNTQRWRVKSCHSENKTIKTNLKVLFILRLSNLTMDAKIVFKVIKESLVSKLLKRVWFLPCKEILLWNYNFWKKCFPLNTVGA